MIVAFSVVVVALCIYLWTLLQLRSHHLSLREALALLKSHRKPTPIVVDQHGVLSTPLPAPTKQYGNIVTSPEHSVDHTEDEAEDESQATTAVTYFPPPTKPKRFVVAITGATGAIIGIRLLARLRDLHCETYLVVSKWAEATIAYETDYKMRAVRALATKTYSAHDVSAPISSGSFKTDAMIVVPCSMKTLSAIATGYGEDLISRAADVCFKERKRLILVARETPLSLIHLRNMTTVTEAGGIIFPPVPAFYVRPESVDDIVNQTVGRIADLLDLDTGNFPRWTGISKFGSEKRKMSIVNDENT